MGVSLNDNKLVIITGTKTFYLDLPKNFHKNFKHEIDFIVTHNEPGKFILNLPQRLDLRSSNKHVVLQNLSIYHTWKNIGNNTKKLNNNTNLE